MIMKEINVDILFKDYEKVPPISSAVRRENLKRIFTGGVRINQGKYRTGQEDRDYREKSLKRQLP